MLAITGHTRTSSSTDYSDYHLWKCSKHTKVLLYIPRSKLISLIDPQALQNFQHVTYIIVNSLPMVYSAWEMSLATIKTKLSSIPSNFTVVCSLLGTLLQKKELNYSFEQNHVLHHKYSTSLGVICYGVLLLMNLFLGSAECSKWSVIYSRPVYETSHIVAIILTFNLLKLCWYICAIPWALQPAS